MISRRPTHMSPIIVTFETSPSSRERSERARRCRTPGPTLPSVVADAASASSVPSADAGDRRVDRDDRRADGPEADVEEDEGRDRAKRPLVDGRPVESDRHHDLRAERLVDLAPEHLAEQEVAHDLDRAAGGARRATDEHQREEREEEQRRPEREVGARHARRRHDRDRLERGRADRRLALGDSVPPEHGGERCRGADDERDVEAELLVAREHARPAADERAVHEREVRAGDGHEQREDPLRLGRERRGRVGCVEKPPVGIVENACASASYGRHQVVDADDPERREHAAPGRASARRRGTRACARSSGCARREQRSPGPGSSDSIICRPPTRSRGSTAIASTMIPMPPSHCVNWRHIPSERLISSKSVTTLAPVVVKPDMPSKYASSGFESWSPPSKRYGIDANAAASSQVSATTRKPSRTPTRPAAPAVSRSSAKPDSARDRPRRRGTGAPARRTPSANGIGKSAASPRYFPSVPTRLTTAGSRSRTAAGGRFARRSASTQSASTTQGAFAASVKMITRSPAWRTSSPCGKIAVAVADDRADDRAVNGHVAERHPDVAARLPRRHVEHLVAVALEHRDLLRARVVREPDDLLGGHGPGVDGDVDPGPGRTRSRRPPRGRSRR